MRKVLTFSLLFLLMHCGQKAGSETENAFIDSDSLDSVNTPPLPATEILKSVNSLTLPLNTANLPRNETWNREEVVKLKEASLHPETVKFFDLHSHDSITLAKVEPTKQPGNSQYWLLGKTHEQSNYIAVLVGSSDYHVQYSLITFTPEAKIIDYLRISEEMSGEGQVSDTESIINTNGSIIVKRGEIYSEPNDILGLTQETVYRIDNTGKFKKESSKEYYKEAIVDWYTNQDAGLLKIEKMRGNSIHFSLNVGSDESCTGEVAGLAAPQPDGKSFRYLNNPKNSSCTIYFVPGSNEMVLNEEGDACEHGFKCQFGGTYKKIATEKFPGVPYYVQSWPGAHIDKFACELKRIFDYEDDQFKCGVKPSEKWDTENASYYAGPKFPKDKFKAVHPMISDIEIIWEHGAIQSVRFKFERELSVESIQRMFNLPRSKEDWTVYYQNIFDISYDGLRAADIRVKNSKLLRAKSLELVAFEHLGSAD